MRAGSGNMRHTTRQAKVPRPKPQTLEIEAGRRPRSSSFKINLDSATPGERTALSLIRNLVGQHGYSLDMSLKHIFLEGTRAVVAGMNGRDTFTPMYLNGNEEAGIPKGEDAAQNPGKSARTKPAEEPKPPSLPPAAKVERPAFGGLMGDRA